MQLVSYRAPLISCLAPLAISDQIFKATCYFCPDLLRHYTFLTNTFAPLYISARIFCHTSNFFEDRPFCRHSNFHWGSLVKPATSCPIRFYFYLIFFIVVLVSVGTIHCKKLNKWVAIRFIGNLNQNVFQGNMAKLKIFSFGLWKSCLEEQLSKIH